MDCAPCRAGIVEAIDLVTSEEFSAVLERRESPYDPYGDGQTARRVVEVLRTVDLDGILKKRFHDLRLDDG